MPLGGLLVAGLLIVAGIEFVRVTHTRPSFDAFGWLTWGRQVLDHWNLNTDGAPSWKPLTFLFTLPYAAFGRTQLSLWTVTASAAALSSGVFAGRIAYRLTGLDGAPVQQRWPAVAAGLFAGIGVLGMTGLPHQMLIATSDPMVVALCLAGIDAHLSGRPRLAFAALVLAALGRPEVWPFAGLYGVWCWIAAGRSRSLVVLGILLVPLGWFVIPGLTSHSWFISGDLALGFPGQIHGSKILGVTNRFLGLYELPMQLAALGAIVLAVVRRERTWLALALAAAMWLGIEIAFAYHGWPASQRYLMEAAAVCIVLAGAAVGRLLDFAVRGARSRLLPGPVLRAGPLTWALRGIALGAVALLAVTLVPIVHHRAALWRSEIRHAKQVAGPLDHLQQVVDRIGGGSAVTACGKPVTFVGFQSALAWNVGLNVGDIGYRPGRAFTSEQPVVYFRPRGDGWIVRPVHTPEIDLAGCARLYTAYDVPPVYARQAIPKPFLLRRLPAALARLEHMRPFRALFAALLAVGHHRHHGRLHHRLRYRLPRRERPRRSRERGRHGSRPRAGVRDRHAAQPARRGAHATVAQRGGQVAHAGATHHAPSHHASGRPAPGHRPRGHAPPRKPKPASA